ncbi:MAG: hypothetical protein V7L21_28300 [Nostoc sp.]|uniref:hypothetical protein n=1 Tax=Nostoc sp. TaxID=1180 RepID=UPI002FFBD2F7
MTIETIASYRFIAGKDNHITTYGAPEEQTVAIHNSSTTSVSLTFTTENTSVLRQIIINLQQIYQTLLNTKTEIIQEDTYMKNFTELKRECIANSTVRGFSSTSDCEVSSIGDSQF